MKQDSSLRRRIVDLEGKPVAGAIVELTSLQQPAEDNGKLDDWEAEGRKGKLDFFELRNAMHFQETVGLQLAKVFQLVRTGANGQFEIPMVGRDRIARLRIYGQTIQATENQDELIHLALRKVQNQLSATSWFPQVRRRLSAKSRYRSRHFVCEAVAFVRGRLCRR